MSATFQPQREQPTGGIRSRERLRSPSGDPLQTTDPRLRDSVLGRLWCRVVRDRRDVHLYDADRLVCTDGPFRVDRAWRRSGRINLCRPVRSQDLPLHARARVADDRNRRTGRACNENPRKERHRAHLCAAADRALGIFDGKWAGDLELPSLERGRVHAFGGQSASVGGPGSVRMAWQSARRLGGMRRGNRQLAPLPAVAP